MNIDEFTTLNNELDTLKEKMREAASKLFYDGFKEFFEEAPEIHSFFWSQYTPYFNDGEACEFSVGELHFLLHVDVDSECEDGEGSCIYSEQDVEYYKNLAETRNSDYYRQRTEEIKAWLVGKDIEMLNRISRVVEKATQTHSSIDESIFYQLFGDHVSIQITATEVIVDEYEHD